MTGIDLTPIQTLELGKIAGGCFSPVTGFMGEEDFASVVSDMRLTSGELFPLPVVLDVDRATAEWVGKQSTVPLRSGGEHVGDISPDSVFTVDKLPVCEAVFGTTEREHPGVRFFLDGGAWFVGGAVSVAPEALERMFADELTPEQTRDRFASRGWQTVVGFQTRNVPHRAHEYLQRTALEHVDGLFIQPLIGRKKTGDYTREAILAGYRALLNECYPENRVELGVLTTAMRYAGPREAVFHAIIRRNYGCTHFIVGRDHAGVGGYYGTYDAQRLATSLGEELGIRIMPLNGPYHCPQCEGIVTEQTCRHFVTEPDSIVPISGTEVRDYLRARKDPPAFMMRQSVAQALHGVSLFIEEDDQ
jgi:sulfate adenylyltransferase